MHFALCFGRIAQLGEHSPYKAGVTGSSPVPPTIRFDSFIISYITFSGR